jgi:hypothetical protein
MALLTLQNITTSGLNVSTTSAAAGGDTIPAGAPGIERAWLQVTNGGGASITVTVAPVSPTSIRAPGVGTVAVPNISVAVPASGTRHIGPFSQAYIDPTTGLTSVTYSAVTSVTVAALGLPAVSQ